MTSPILIVALVYPCLNAMASFKLGERTPRLKFHMQSELGIYLLARTFLFLNKQGSIEKENAVTSSPHKRTTLGAFIQASAETIEPMDFSSIFKRLNRIDWISIFAF